ncbi:hypothetical protein ACWCPQ_17535 [Nocardia sp. NPDC001965]
MGESLWVDIDALRDSSAELDQAAARTAAMVNELEAELTRRGEFWGDDEPGALFAQSYLPGVEQAMTGMKNLVAALRRTEQGFTEAAEVYSLNDLAGANHVDAAGPATIIGESGPARPEGYRGPATHAVPDYADRTTGYLPHTDETTRWDHQGEREPGPSRTAAAPYSPAPSPDTEVASPRSTDPAGSANPRQDRPGLGELGAPTSVDEFGVSTPAARDGAPAANAQPPNTLAANAGDGSRVKPISDRQPGPAGRAAGTSSPAGSGNSPWVKPPTATASAPTSATAPQQGTPPRTYPPRPQTPHKPEKQVAAKPSRSASGSREEHRKTSDAEAMRIARAMAARHHLEIRGFETAGLDQHTVRQIEAALDDVLGRYAPPLCGIEIDQFSGPPSRAEKRCTTSDSDPSEVWIVLDPGSAANPPHPTGPGRSVPQPAAAADQQRPLYLTTLRALGSVLDISGAYRARAEAQRALITEYLRVHGSKGDTLARVVHGYKRWRGELSDSCFQDRVLAPGPALGDAFAAVESNSASAGSPQTVLHRLLVTLAKTPGADT